MSDNYKVKTLTGEIDWVVEVPGSKSMTNRALLMAALADGKTTLKGILFSDDSRHFLASLQALGFDVEISEDAKEVTVTGLNGKLPVEEGEINVGSAGTAARFLTAMLAMAKGTFTIQASEQMKKRPMKTLFELLAGMGAKIEYLEEEDHLPVRITGIGGAADATTRKLKLDISESTQFLSAMLLISPMLKEGLEIEITSDKKDGSYIRITRKMMEQFGVTTSYDEAIYRVPKNASYQAGEYQIEPDVSAACYFYAAAALLGGRALVKNVTAECMQGDLKFLKVLQDMGCHVAQTRLGIAVSGPRDGKLKGVCVDMNDFSDQTMTLAALAPFAEKVTRIEHIGHIRLQESDRIQAIVTELTRLGITCIEEDAAITIYEGEIRPGVIETYEDHRMAMAFSLIGLKVPGIEIADPMCCRKTFEEYFDVLDALTAEDDVS